jgi:hypothetical protein
VHRDVVVIPTQCGQIVRIVVSTMGSMLDMMDLEPIVGLAGLVGASVVSGQDEPTQAGTDRAGLLPEPHRLAFFGDTKHFDLALT